MTSFNSVRLESFRTTIIEIHSQLFENNKLRFISSQVSLLQNLEMEKLNAKSLDLISQFNYADKDLIHDLRYIINSISEDKFIQAILSFQPFKSKYKHTNFLDIQGNCNKQNSTIDSSGFLTKKPRTKLPIDNSIIQKGSFILKKKNSFIKQQPKTCESFQTSCMSNKDDFLKQYLEVILQEQSLKKQFDRNYHPFKKIIDSFVFIVENKYKNLMDQCKDFSIQKIQQMLSYDILVVEKLFIKIAQPYENIYTSQNPQQTKIFKVKMQNFVKKYVRSHEKLTYVIRKLMRYFARNSKKIGLHCKKNIRFCRNIQFSYSLRFQNRWMLHSINEFIDIIRLIINSFFIFIKIKINTFINGRRCGLFLQFLQFLAMSQIILNER